MGKKYIIELEEAPFVQHFENGIEETVYRVKGFNSLVFDWNGLQMLTPYTEDSAYAHGYTEAESKYREIRDELEKQAYQRGYETAMHECEDCQKIRNDAEQELEDSAYAHGYTEAESKYREIRDELEKQAYQRGYETAKHECEDCQKIRYDAEQELVKKAYDTAYADAEGIYESGKRVMYQKGLKDAWEAARKIRDMTWKEQIEAFGTDSYADIIALSASECIEKIRQYEQRQEEIQVGDEVEAMAGNAVVIEVIDGGQTVRYMYPDTITGRNKACNVTRTGRHFPEIAAVLEKMQMKDGDNE